MSMNIDEDKNYTGYIFVIYSCRKNLEQARNLYLYFNLDSVFPDCKCFIMYGDPDMDDNMQYRLTDTRGVPTIVLNVKDGYGNLSEKTICLFDSLYKMFPNTFGVFKCDDDVVLNIQCVLNYMITFKDISKDNKYGDPSYFGRVIYITHKSMYTGDDIDSDITLEYPINIHYCAGPIYYISGSVLVLFTPEHIYPNSVNIPYEDIMVGNNLISRGILPVNNYMYGDGLESIGYTSLHNKNNSLLLFDSAIGTYSIPNTEWIMVRKDYINNV
jgi:hypothetical protein